MDDSEKRGIAEALIVASGEPLPAAKLASLIPRCTPKKARSLVEGLNAEYAAQQRSFEIREVAGGFQLRTLPEYASYLQKLRPTRPLRLSHAALESLAIVAYRQPVTRAEVEYVRGVDAGPVLRSLLERKLVKIAGHREVPGRPMLYATTKRFLEVFGLTMLDDLPTLRDLADLAASRESAVGDAGDQRAALPPELVSEPQALPAVPSLSDLEPSGEPH